MLKLEGLDDRDQALELVRHRLQVPGSDLVPLAEGEYYLFQIVGLQVVTDEGE